MTETHTRKIARAELVEKVAEARALLQVSPAGAVALLERARQGTDDVPAVFDILLARAYVSAGLAPRAVDLLQARCDAGGSTPKISIALGNALRNSDRRREAVTHFKAALGETGQAASVRDRDMLKGMVAYDAGNKAMLIYVPKVACTVLKATVVMNSPLRERYSQWKQGIHRFVKAVTPAGEVEALMADPSVFRWTVLREPVRRLLSAYLNKIVGSKKSHSTRFYKLKAIREAQALAGVPFDLERSITFEEFVRYVAVTEDSELNVHWLPQARIVGQDLAGFSHVGTLENLEATFTLLKERFGYEAVRDPLPHLGGATHHSATFSKNAWLDEPFRRLPGELRSKEGFPVAGSFLNPELIGIIRDRYSDDVRLYASLVKGE